MSLSGIQSSSLLSELSSSSVSSSSSSQNSFQSALKKLISAIKSGDTTDAKTYLAQVQQLTPSNADSNSPLGKFIASVSTALDSNNISSAQSALTQLENSKPPSGTAPASSSDTSSGALSEVAQDVISLFTSISSGDLTSAKSAFDSLTNLLTGDSTGSTSTSTAANTVSSSATASSATDASFSSLLSDIGSALDSGNISSAQTALSTFLQSLSKGSLVDTSA